MAGTAVVGAVVVLGATGAVGVMRKSCLSRNCTIVARALAIPLVINASGVTAEALKPVLQGGWLI